MGMFKQACIQRGQARCKIVWYKRRHTTVELMLRFERTNVIVLQRV
jgi:hypothetical protein